MLTALWTIMLELSPWMLLGAIVAGILHVVVPDGWLRRHLSGRAGVLKAVCIGIPLPLCSCGVIPVGLGLRKDGASRGASVGFLIATPQTGVDSVLVSGSFLGWPFALFKVAAALITGVFGGMLTDVSRSSASVIAATDSIHSEAAVIPRRGSAAFVTHSFMLIESVWRWLVVGIVVSALITWLVPENSLASVPGMTGITAMIATLILSVPLYVCATASVPIAAALVASGLPPGAALVFLMAGPATNVATLGAVYRKLGGRALAIYLVTIVTGSIIAGLAFDGLIDTSATAVMQHDHSEGIWRQICAVVFSGLIGWCVVRDVRHWWRKRSAGNSIVTADSSATRTLAVQGMTCQGCANRLERALQSVDGVRQVTVSFDDASAVVSGDAAAEALVEATKSAGFNAEPRPTDTVREGAATAVDG